MYAVISLYVYICAEMHFLTIPLEEYCQKEHYVHISRSIFLFLGSTGLTFTLSLHYLCTLCSDLPLSQSCSSVDIRHFYMLRKHIRVV